MLNKKARERIQKSRIQRAVPQWQQKRDTYADRLVHLSIQALLSTKHLSDEARVTFDRDRAKRQERAGVVVAMNRQAWQALEKTLAPVERWTAKQWALTLAATPMANWFALTTGISVPKTVTSQRVKTATYESSTGVTKDLRDLGYLALINMLDEPHSVKE